MKAIAEITAPWSPGRRAAFRFLFVYAVLFLAAGIELIAEPLVPVGTASGVLRGIVRADTFSDLFGTCEQSIDGILFEVRPPASNNCATASTQPGCSDVWTEACACYDDPYCCDTAWDQQCVSEQLSCA